MTRRNAADALLWTLAAACVALFFSKVPGNAVLWTGSTCYVVASIALFMMYGLRSHPQEAVSRGRIALRLIAVLAAGTFARLWIAVNTVGNDDLISWWEVARLAADGRNLYASTRFYDWTPIWSWVLKALYLNGHGLRFDILVKGFLIAIDALTALALYALARSKGWDGFRAVLFFYLCPVSVLLTGFHGNFDNFALLYLVIGLLAYELLRHRSTLGPLALWFFTTLAALIKHNVCYQVVVVLNAAFRGRWTRALLAAVTAGVFLAMLAPYWRDGHENILHRVIFYRSMPIEGYGFGSWWLTNRALYFLFVPAVFIFPFFVRGRELISQCLLCFLFFLTFTTGMGNQYLVLPLAVGALRPSRAFLAYTAAASLYLLGSRFNLDIPAFRWVPATVAWLGAAGWFVSEWKRR